MIQLFFSGLKHFVKFLSLGHGPWESVEDKAVKQKEVADVRKWILIKADEDNLIEYPKDKDIMST